jgi:hypothetical protein
VTGGSGSGGGSSGSSGGNGSGGNGSGGTNESDADMAESEADHAASDVDDIEYRANLAACEELLARNKELLARNKELLTRKDERRVRSQNRRDRRRQKTAENVLLLEHDKFSNQVMDTNLVSTVATATVCGTSSGLKVGNVDNNGAPFSSCSTYAPLASSHSTSPHSTKSPAASSCSTLPSSTAASSRAKGEHLLLTTYTASRSFEALCEGIRNDDPSIIKVKMPLSDRNRLDLLLTALQGNTKVTSLSLGVGSKWKGKFESASLVQYLKEGESIRSVKLKDSLRYYPQIIGDVMRSLIENPSAKLEAFDSRFLLPCKELLALLHAKSQFLKRLSICGIHSPPSGYPLWIHDWIWRQTSHAIRSLAVLESLSLAFAYPNDGNIELLFGEMHSHACLRKLQISKSYAQNDCAMIPSLRSLLCSGVRLEKLELAHFDFGEEMIEQLVHGMASCQSLAHLSLEDCTFRNNPAVASTLVRFLQSSRETRSRYLSEEHAGSTSVRIATASLSSGSEIARATDDIGSSSQVVHLRYNTVDVLQDVLNPLAKEGAQLLSLTLCHTPETIALLTQDLPIYLRLRNLTFQMSSGQSSTWSVAFLLALRKNGSLHKVTATMEDGEPVGNWIQSWCDRNRVAPTLLSQLNLTSEACDHEQTPMHLSPLLYKVVSQTPRMAPTWLLSGLLASSDAIGVSLNSPTKRLRSN